MPDRPSIFFRFLILFGRVLVATVGFAALGMGLGLMAGIIYLVISSGIHHAHPDMTEAYRLFAIPLAVVLGGGAFVYSLVSGIRTAVRTHA